MAEIAKGLDAIDVAEVYQLLHRVQVSDSRYLHQDLIRRGGTVQSGR